MKLSNLVNLTPLKEWANLDHDDMYTILDIAAPYTDTQHEAADQMWNNAQDLYDYLKSDHIDPQDRKDFFMALQSNPIGADIQDDEFYHSGMSYDDMLKKHYPDKRKGGDEPKLKYPFKEADSEPDYEWEKGSKAGPGNPKYDAAREKAKQDTRFTIDGKPVDLGSIEMDGLENMRRYGPDDGGPDAYILSAEFIDGTPLSDIQREKFQDEYPEITHEKALEQMYQQEGAVGEGSCGYTQSAPGGEELDTPGDTQGMDADNRTKTIIKKLIQKEIAKLHENR